MSYHCRIIACLLLLILSSFHPLTAETTEVVLRENLFRAQPGDYLVTAQGKNYTVLLIRSKENDYLNVEEITVPISKINQKSFSWRKWVEEKAPGNTCWIMHFIHLPSGAIPQTFSFTKNEWINIPQSQNFLSTLLNLRLSLVPERERKRVGPPPSSDLPDRRPMWQPPLVVEGQIKKDALFNAWKTRWPKDNTELSGKIIEVYLPRENARYPSYFPYWLQINGLVGKAKVRIVDSGSQLFSRAQLPFAPSR